MKIALIAPPWIAIPPVGYGGIERVVYDLAEGLKKKGHDVILYATGDSHVSVDLRYFYEKSLGKDILLEKSYVYYFLNQVHFALSDMPKDVDIIHNHCEYVGMHILDGRKTPFVHTLHGAFYQSFDEQRHISDHTTQALRETLQFFKNHPFISISDSQRKGMLDLNYIRTVYNGTDITNFQYTESPEDYMVWLGRYSPLKGLEEAIQVAKTTQRKLHISASVHKVREALFKKDILSQADNKLLVSVPETQDHHAKSTLLGKAKLFLFPLQWEEPFGIVMTEAMAAGTPVVAYARGSAPEVIKDGVTGFLVNPSDTDIRGEYIIKKTGLTGIAEAVERIYAMKDTDYTEMRRQSRNRVKDHFTVEAMVEGYEEAYQKVLGKI